MWRAQHSAFLSEQLCSAGISEPLPVAATFHMPDASGNTLDKYATIDTMVRAWPVPKGSNTVFIPVIATR